MFFGIISGGIGSGKSDCLYEYMRENLKNNPGTNAILIVPEQFSYTAEKTLSEKFGGLGLNRIEVLTFSRLISRFVPGENSLLSAGKAMLLSKACENIGDDNIFLTTKKRGGFVTSMSELFSEFKRYNIFPEDLDITSQSPAIQKKIDSINEIYKSYLSFFEDGFFDSEDAPAVFAEYAKSTDTFKNTFFFIDDYNDFMPQHYEILKALTVSSRGVFATLTIGKSEELFAPVEKTKSRLLASALSQNAQVFTKELSGSAEYIKAPDIRFLLENWEDKPVYDGKCENISIFTARDAYSELEHTAAQILTLVRKNGFRFRDIGIIIGDMPSYLHILNAVFADFNIPFFTDEKLNVAMHPIVRTVMSIYEIISKNWNFNAVFSYLRAGYVYIEDDTDIHPIDPEDIDLMENYVLSCGIRGKKAWFSEWKNQGETVFDDIIENYSAPSFDLERLNRLRRAVICPFEHFLETRGRSGKAIAGAVYGFLCDIHLYEGLITECENLSAAGFRDEAEQTRQIWNTVIEILDQAALTLGNDTISRENFFGYLKNAFAACSISIIPSGLDRVSVGTVQRNSPSRVRALFILGANHGCIPQEPTAGSVLTPADREFLTSALAEKDKELAPDDIGRIALENLKLYRAISTATEKLFISYPVTNSDGNALSAAYFVSEIKKMFPKISESDNILEQAKLSELIASPKNGFFYMLRHLSEYYRDTPSKAWQTVYSWYSAHPKYREKLHILNAAAKYKLLQPRLSREKAKLLYGSKNKYSITALEKFNRCPFSYYVEKGLNAEAQQVKKIDASHIGSLIHAAVCEFCRRVEGDSKNIADLHERWTALSSQDAVRLMNDVCENMKKSALARAGGDEKRLEYLMHRLSRTLEKSVDTIRNSLSAGGYTPVCYEKNFETNIESNGKSLTLFGCIDRIDVLEDRENMCADLRIVDYKSGRKKFSIASIVNKIDMQLVLYAVAAENLFSNGGIELTDSTLSPRLSAILYSRINDELAKTERDDQTLAEKILKNQRKLDGVIIADDGEDELLYNMDLQLETSGDSSYLNVSYKKSGGLTSTSQVTSRKDFSALCSYMKKSAIESAGKIADGCIDINPYSLGQGTSCTYCEFADICMFDHAPTGYRKLFSSDAAAMEFIKKEEDNE